jgi:5-methyltetrahydrofolate--homocysteine methyltransferase
VTPRQSFLDRLRREVLVLDGSMGALLQARGLPDGHAPDLWNLENPAAIEGVQREYAEAGADIILTNTFGSTRLWLAEYGAEGKVREINEAAVAIARRAASGRPVLVAGDIGPSGTTIEPFGELPFEEAVALFREQAEALVRAGVDLVAIETMFDLTEAKAALIAVREAAPSLPVVAHLTFNRRGVTDTGTDPETAAIVLEACGADVVGVNCSVGPEDMMDVVGRMGRATALPLCVQPNAGLPVLRGGRSVFPLGPGDMAPFARQFVERGAAIVGGCCGTTPEYVRRVAAEVRGMTPAATSRAPGVWIASRSRALRIGAGAPFVIVGERINPTGRKKYAEAIREGRTDLIVADARKQAEAHAAALDVNVGVPLVDEPAMMRKAVVAVQNAVELPLVLDSSYLEALEQGMRACPGRPLVNSVDPDPDKAARLLPLVRRFGCAVIGMLAEAEIPESAVERVRNAEKVLALCERHGIGRDSIVFDCLSLTVSAAPAASAATLDTIRAVSRDLGCATIIGLSNVSFGLPGRRAVNNAFVAQAIASGLDAAIASATDDELWEVAHAASLFAGRDPGCRRYMDLAVRLERRRKLEAESRGRDARGQSAGDGAGEQAPAEPALRTGAGPRGVRELLFDAVVEGDKDGVEGLTRRALEQGEEPFGLFLDVLTPAIRRLGDLFGAGKKFIPHLIAAADAMKAGVAILTPHLERAGGVEKKGTVVLATVKGDIHDIGKNIVGLMMRNFGYEVHDLGRNVPTEVVIEEAGRTGAQIIGLSALMTTTMMRMKDVVDEVARRKLPHVVLVGGAVTTSAFARDIGADGHAKDVGEVAEATEKMMALHRDRFGSSGS